MYSKIRIFGHPIHPMLVAYPVAMYTATLVGMITFWATEDIFWLRLAIAANVAGVVTAVLAALPGLVDWAFGIPAGTEAKRTGLLHMAANVGALGFFAINLAYYIDSWNGDPKNAIAGIYLSAMGVAFTIFAGFMGWKMVQDHHVGVRLVPSQRQVEPLSEQQIKRAG